MIGFLERLGQDEALRHASADELTIALERMELDPAFRAAVLQRDRTRLEVLLQCKATICCGLVRPDEDDEQEEEPSKEDEEVRALHAA